MTDFGAQCGAYEDILEIKVTDFGQGVKTLVLQTSLEEPSVAVRNHSDPGPHQRRSGQWNVNNIAPGMSSIQDVNSDFEFEEPRGTLAPTQLIARE